VPSYPIPSYDTLFSFLAFVLGAVAGSFLNVCIYRMPRDLSVNRPRRSFCPNCKKRIPFSQNIPLISWLFLRGRCASCGERIPFRYFTVELLTALLFLAVWLQFRSASCWLLVFPYWILVGLLIVATFIDFEHFIIPDEITWGGAVAGLILSFVIPQMMMTGSNIFGLLWSLVGAATGYFLLWGVVELGKIAFGKKRAVYDEPELFEWTRKGDDAEIRLGEELMLWSDMFAREKDQLVLLTKTATIDGNDFRNETLTFFYNRLLLKGREFPLGKIDNVKADVIEVVIPREAMGFGDVKLIACIGAFLGWQAVIFTVVAASVVGACVGVATIAIGKRELSSKIPFGPYLALGALIWIFYGWDIVTWYLNLSSPSIP
jgi:leader peptidase (prepilin peptidase)/N-methyltransferase